MSLPEPKPEAPSRPPRSRVAAGDLRDPDALLAAWTHLLETHKHLHAPDAARMLEVPEAALVACRIGSGAVRLTPDIAAALAPVSAWGRVLCAFSNPCGVHMPLGAVSAEAGDGTVRLQGTHMWAEIDAGAVADAYLFVDRDDSHGNTRSIQFYNAAGAPILKVFVFHKTRFGAAEAHFAALTADDQSRTVDVARPAAGGFDARAASLAEDPVAAPLEEAHMASLIASLLETGGGFQIELVGDHARVAWRGTLSGARMDERMFHLHETDLRSHLRYAPMLSAARTQTGALAIDGETGRLLRIAKGHGR